MSKQSIQTDEYEAFRKYLEEASGIALGEDKQYLVANRLAKLLKELALDSIQNLVEILKKNPPAGLQKRVIEAMTTNETSWFRDGHPFEILKKVVLPEAAKKKTREIRIWSAACSSGQEPYSISMILQEFMRENPGRLSFSQIVSTEISSTMLQSAREGVYTKFSLSRGLSKERRDRFFISKDEQWQVKPEIRDCVIFKELNLLDSYVMLGRFDVIFCRNVLIYFSESAKAEILRRITQTLQPNGYLFLGGSESLTECAADYEVLHFSNGIVYKLRDKSG